MNIVVRYANGMVEEFDTNALTSPDPFRGSSGDFQANICTDVQVRLDLLEAEGLRIDVYWYDTLADRLTRRVRLGPDGTSAEVDGDGGGAGLVTGVLNRQLAGVLYVIDRAELEDIDEVEIDGKVALRKVAGGLVDQILFDKQVACYMGRRTDDSMVDLIQQLHERVRAAHQDWDDGEIAASYGIGLGTYLRFCGAKAALDELESHHADSEERLARACAAALAEDPSVAPAGVAELTGASVSEVMRVWERARGRADDMNDQGHAPTGEANPIDPLFVDEQVGRDGL